MDTYEMLLKIKESHAEVARRVEAMDDTDLVRPRRDDGWSARDIICHLGAWYDVAAERLRLMAEGRPGQIRWLASSEDLRVWNAAFHQRSEEFPPPEARAYFADTHERVVAGLESVPEGGVDIEGIPIPIERWLPNCTFEHDREHLADLS